MKRDVKDRILNVTLALSVVLVLLVVLEGGAFVASRIHVHNNAGRELAYPVENEYLNAVRQKASALERGYCPYLEVCSMSLAETNYSLAGVGERTTVNPCSSSTAKQVFVFGGSTTFDAEVFDEDTWPSQLSAELCKRGYAVHVRNFGEGSYVSTQETLKLVLLLRDGERPDYVLFLDGFNDMYSAYQNGVTGLPHNTALRNFSYTVFNGNSLFNGFYASWVFRGLQRGFSSRAAITYSEAEARSLSERTMMTYKGNADVVHTLGDGYGFTPLFFWQPVACTKQSATAVELQYCDYKEFMMFYQNTSVLQRVEGFSDITDAFDKQQETVFIDAAHTGRTGNRLLAGRIADIVEREFASDGIRPQTK